MKQDVRPVLTQKELKPREIAKNLAKTAKALEILRGKCADAQLAVSKGLAEARNRLASGRDGEDQGGPRARQVRNASRERARPYSSYSAASLGATACCNWLQVIPRGMACDNSPVPLRKMRDVALPFLPCFSGTRQAWRDLAPKSPYPPRSDAEVSAAR